MWLESKQKNSIKMYWRRRSKTKYAYVILTVYGVTSLDYNKTIGKKNNKVRVVTVLLYDTRMVQKHGKKVKRQN
jgi:hypothetical protein